MQQLKSDLIKQVISLDDLEPIKKHSELEERIKEGAEVLAQRMRESKELEKTGTMLPAKSITDKIQWGHFSAKIAQMRNDDKLPQDVTAAKRGDSFYLIKLPKGQTVQPRRKKETSNNR